MSGTVKILMKLKSYIVTASGGPFLNREKSFFENATVDEALNPSKLENGNKIPHRFRYDDE